jgi:hypothetical protein
VKTAVALAACMALAVSLSAGDWALSSRDKGIEVFHEDVPGSKVVALKGHGTIDAPLWKVASILLDTKRAPEWVDSLKESRVVRRVAFDRYVEFNHLGLPFILKDRDFVSDVQIAVDPAAKTFALVYKPTDDADAPKTGDVRGEILAGRFLARSTDDSRGTDLTAELHCDPRGAIPKWVVNFFQKSWPQNTFEAIRKQAAKPDIAMPSEFRDILGPTERF